MDEVVEVIKNSEQTIKMINISVTNTIIHSTWNHKFMLADGRWVSAENLKVGDKLQTDSGEVEITNIDVEIKTIVTYNLKTKNNRNFFITDKNILVEDYKLHG